MKTETDIDTSYKNSEYYNPRDVDSTIHQENEIRRINNLNKLFNTATIDMPKVDVRLGFKKKPVYNFFKRCFDLILSSLAIIVLSPIFLLTTLIVKLQDGGPVFFIQKRVGLNGKKFNMFKFRSMCPDAEQKIADLLDKNEATGPMFKIKDDPRVTPFGKFIRKTSIDELPQLFNIFAGSMSIVGPRPALPREANLYSKDQKYRLLVKPGLTCIWQVSGRSNLPFEAQIEMDKEYIRKRNLLMDAILIVKTVPAVIKHDGAV